MTKNQQQQQRKKWFLNYVLSYGVCGFPRNTCAVLSMKYICTDKQYLLLGIWMKSVLYLIFFIFGAVGSVPCMHEPLGRTHNIRYCFGTNARTQWHTEQNC